MDNHFDSKGGKQNTGIGNGAIGQQNNNGVPHEVFAQYVKELGATEQVVEGFFGTLLKEKVPRDQWDSKLREIAATHKELLARLDSVQDADPQVAKLKAEAKQAMDAGDYAKTEALLEDVANQHSISAAETYAELADLQRVQLRYVKAAAYWQKAAALLPEDKKKERSLYLHSAGYDLHRIAKYKEALPLWEQSLVIRREIGDRAGEGTTLNNISQIYKVRGDYGTALKHLEQSLVICREIGDKAGEGTTLSNIGALHHARDDYGMALKYLEQSLVIHCEVGNRAMEGTTLNNIGQIYHARDDYGTALKYMEQGLVIHREVGDRAGEGRTLNNLATTAYAKGDYDAALKYLEQSLVISQEIGDRLGEAVMSWNIGRAYEDQGDLRKAEPYISRTVQLEEEISLPTLDESRKALERVRAKLKGR